MTPPEATHTEAAGTQAPEACDMNLGPRERQRRLYGGYIGAGVTVVALVALVALHAPRGWRLLLFAPLALAAVGFLQFAARTCVHLAARGLRNLDEGDEKITDFTVRLALRRRAQRILAAAVGIAAVLTVLVYLM